STAGIRPTASISGAPTRCRWPMKKAATRGPGIPPRPAADRPGSPARSIRNSTLSIGVSANPEPFNAAGRKGDNLYTCSVLALDPKTGAIKWHYQFSPNNPFDYDSVAEMILSTIDVKGKPTKVLIDANRNGFIYVLDRTNGKLIAANPYVKVNWASSIDMATGRPVETEISTKARAGEQVDVWPSILGGKNWEPGSFDPK